MVLGKSYNLDEKSKKFLRVVYESGSRASTKEIREVSGLDSDEITYRFRKLHRQELIRIEKNIPAHNGVAMKVAILTEDALELIQDYGVLDGVEAKSNDDEEYVDQEVRDHLSDAVFPRLRGINRDLLKVIVALNKEGINVDDIAVSDEELVEYYEKLVEREQR